MHVTNANYTRQSQHDLSAIHTLPRHKRGHKKMSKIIKRDGTKLPTAVTRLFLKHLRGIDWDQVSQQRLQRLRRKDPNSPVRKLAAGFVLGATLGRRRSGKSNETLSRHHGRRYVNWTTVPTAYSAMTQHHMLAIWCLAQELVRWLDPSYKATSIQVNKNFRSHRVHTDRNNISHQFALSLGDFKGGELVMETADEGTLARFKTKNRIARVDGRRNHYVTPYTGERFSLIIYSIDGPRITPILTNFEEQTSARPFHYTSGRCRWYKKNSSALQRA